MKIYKKLILTIKTLGKSKQFPSMKMMIKFRRNFNKKFMKANRGGQVSNSSLLLL